MTTNPTGNDFKPIQRDVSFASYAKPVIRCGYLSSFDAADLDAVSSAFGRAASCDLRQTWRADLESNFAPGRVQVGWRWDELLVFAKLTDLDIYSDTAGHNQRTWELGDTFEMFFRLDGQSECFEFHVTPNNHRLQLRIPHTEALQRARAACDFQALQLPGNAFHSATWVQPGNQKWYVYAAIPALTLCRLARLSVGMRWHFSFSRYDYSHGHAKPVLSSSSPHLVADFHRQPEWGEFMLEHSI